MFATNLATLMILVLGGRFVIHGTMTLGDFTAFNSYLAILIFPVIMIGFMSNVMAQASASYARIAMVLDAPDRPPAGGPSLRRFAATSRCGTSSSSSARRRS